MVLLEVLCLGQVVFAEPVRIGLGAEDEDGSILHIIDHLDRVHFTEIVGPPVRQVHVPVLHGHLAFLKHGFLADNLRAILAMSVWHNLSVVLPEGHLHEHLFVKFEGLEDHFEASVVDLCDHIDSLLLVGVSLEVHVAALVGEAWVVLLFLLLNVR